MVGEWIVLCTAILAGVVAGFAMSVVHFFLIVVPLSLVTFAVAVVNLDVQWWVVPTGWISQQSAYFLGNAVAHGRRAGRVVGRASSRAE